MGDVSVRGDDSKWFGFVQVHRGTESFLLVIRKKLKILKEFQTQRKEEVGRFYLYHGRQERRVSL